MLKEKEIKDYYRFRIPYWDWQKEKQTKANSPFQKNRLGETRDNHGLPQVHGGMFNDWTTICWKKGSTICNPAIRMDQLQRCPFTDGGDPCSSDNDLWPSLDEVEEALSLQAYDTSHFNVNASDSFRNQLEGFKVLPSDDLQSCRSNKLCKCDVGGPNCNGDQPGHPIQRLLHNSVSICSIYT